ncbi:hypothetical protein ACFOLA_03645 [Salinicoccus hispanicus]|uniref:Uncharacterized protein n=1 Tax=Salinicoccus hispanicus TaxID=157225 RepID=A0A6N8U1F9_9STAP|nr:hypothetical protein [Salinicoccus hispanicus]MXQ51910.1 hypothetical protein [Salinicoccus hispanicus]
MKQYQFKLSVDSNRKVLAIEDKNNEAVGYVEKAVLKNCEEQNTYSYTSIRGTTVILGLKRRRFKDMNISKYIIVTDDAQHVFKEKPGRNLIQFKVVGQLDEHYMKVEENSDGDMEAHIDKKYVATVKEKGADGNTAIMADSELDDLSMKFGIIVLMYFMYKLYKRETWDVAKLLE